jgi:hypothetical protein
VKQQWDAIGIFGINWNQLESIGCGSKSGTSKIFKGLHTMVEPRLVDPHGWILKRVGMNPKG